MMSMIVFTILLLLINGRFWCYCNVMDLICFTAPKFNPFTESKLEPRPGQWGREVAEVKYDLVAQLAVRLSDLAFAKRSYCLQSRAN